MHDFCFTIPYGLILIGGGVFGYFKKGSTASLAGGVGTGLVLVLAGYLSLKAFEKRKNSHFALIVETDLRNKKLGKKGVSLSKNMFVQSHSHMSWGSVIIKPLRSCLLVWLLGSVFS
ncbi:protein FATTY ACID EXPORT 6-like isoform X2 [Tripterygium wilfordii]|uniref:protein FATTY ACID EXPORT 6-like isoform X2 n=1 Tax=Tripterygium wilfordii TaxID=458696 RepID=UPI0018F856EC|nr:protein FATTY ACID EXPORT 6-like isoform X2 [Tripterygium wilfordii]